MPACRLPAGIAVFVRRCCQASLPPNPRPAFARTIPSSHSHRVSVPPLLSRPWSDFPLSPGTRRMCRGTGHCRRRRRRRALHLPARGVSDVPRRRAVDCPNCRTHLHLGPRTLQKEVEVPCGRTGLVDSSWPASKDSSGRLGGWVRVNVDSCEHTKRQRESMRDTKRQREYESRVPTRVLTRSRGLRSGWRCRTTCRPRWCPSRTTSASSAPTTR